MLQCSGRSAVRLARFNGVEEVGGSNPPAPTIIVDKNYSDYELSPEGITSREIF